MPRPNPAGAHVAVFVVFALVAALLAGRTLADTRGIGSDLRHVVAPRFGAAAADPAVVALLERGGMLTEDVALRLLPIGEALGRTADATDAAAVDAAAVRDHAGSLLDSLSAVQRSTTRVRVLADALAPAIVAVVEGTGDIAARLGAAQRQSGRAARLLEQALAGFGDFAADAASLRARTTAIARALERVEAHGSSIAKAHALDCPRDPRSCLPDPR